MIRDWHATYLTDRVVMAAAARHANTTGDDGYAAAATLALSMAPAITSSAAIGARAILAPGADALDEIEEAQLAHASWRGYYDNPGIDADNHDMAPSMTRRARPEEKIRPDLICPSCCRRRGQPEESGVQRQVYRCTESDCPAPLWEYIPPVDDDTHETHFAPGGFAEGVLIGPGGQVYSLVDRAWIDEAVSCGRDDCPYCQGTVHSPPDQGPFTDAVLPPWPCPRCDPQGARAAPPDAAHRCPHCGRAWTYSPDSAGGPPLNPGDPAAVWAPVSDPQRRADAMAHIASVMGIPPEVLASAPAATEVAQPRDITAEVHALLNIDPGLSIIGAIQRLAARVASEVEQAAAFAFDRQLLHGEGGIDTHGTPEQAWEQRRETEAQLLAVLERVSAGRVHVGEASIGGMQVAWRQQLVTVNPPRHGMSVRDQSRLRPLVRLTNLGRMELRRLRQRARQGLI